MELNNEKLREEVYDYLNIVSNQNKLGWQIRNEVMDIFDKYNPLPPQAEKGELASIREVSFDNEPVLERCGMLARAINELIRARNEER